MKENFHSGKKVLVTGHTGFKGSWMCSVLIHQNANVLGYSLTPPTEPALYRLLSLDEKMESVVGDIRNLEKLISVFKEFQPEIVIHMAAQPIVRESYANPVYTYDVNVMGTVNVLEAIRQTESVKSAVIVTTDKVYKNMGWVWGYRENDELNGFDPYSNSKSCAELVTGSYCNSFFKERDIAVSAARAGNVIGGGDFSVDRIIPDCYRAAVSGNSITVRNPFSVRPYQHVLEPVMAYLDIAAKQYGDMALASTYNIGPDTESCLMTGDIVDAFCACWNQIHGSKVKRIDKAEANAPHEDHFLKLDNTKYKTTFGWKPVWNINQAIEKTVELYSVIAAGRNAWEKMQKQIDEYADGLAEICHII